MIRILIFRSARDNYFGLNNQLLHYTGNYSLNIIGTKLILKTTESINMLCSFLVIGTAKFRDAVGIMVRDLDVLDGDVKRIDTSFIVILSAVEIANIFNEISERERPLNGVIDSFASGSVNPKWFIRHIIARLEPSDEAVHSRKCVSARVEEGPEGSNEVVSIRCCFITVDESSFVVRRRSTVGDSNRIGLAVGSGMHGRICEYTEYKETNWIGQLRLRSASTLHEGQRIRRGLLSVTSMFLVAFPQLLIIIFITII